MRVILGSMITKPCKKEEQEFVDAIKKDVEWLGFKWDAETVCFNYFSKTI